MGIKKKKFLIFSVDTEPDSLNWQGFQSDNLTYDNLTGISRLMASMKNYNIKPTFLVSYSIARQSYAQQILTQLLKQESCEIGTHFHPGDIPLPGLPEETESDNILEVPADILEQKFNLLHKEICHRFGPPLSFRAGAWAINKPLFSLLENNGYTVDSSITPGISWQAIKRPSFVNYPSNAFYPHVFNKDLCDSPSILEVPVSIYSPTRHLKRLPNFYLRSLFTMPLASRQGSIYSLIRTVRPYTPQWLRPAFTPIKQMLKVSRIMLAQYGYIHIMCHSNELTEGTSPYSATEEMVDRFYLRLKTPFHFAKSKKLQPITLAKCTTPAFQHCIHK